ncbi:MAG: hypothetical protein KIT80_06805 [Chitinophagaceae bacterium]|nr:hypothetical protein [Chitinophagaceae bacterium]MCW5926607.1 hypothetical protein [Chitinophagaceae bacterium]
MKKIISGLFICATLVAFASCKKTKDTLNCTVSLTKLMEAQSAYNQEEGFSAEKCTAYKKALEEVLQASCSGFITDEARQGYESALEELGDCNPR